MTAAENNRNVSDMEKKWEGHDDKRDNLKEVNCPKWRLIEWVRYMEGLS
jgi:hypothetical protein